MVRVTSMLIVVGLGLLVVGCGDDDELADLVDSAPTDAAGGSEDAVEGEGDGASDPADGGADGSEGLTPPPIDPASMPPTGDTRLEVEGLTFDFAAADAAQGPAYSCSVEDGAIRAELQVPGGTFLARGDQPDGATWFGSVTISHPDTERIYFSVPGTDGTFAVDGSVAVYEGEFFWRTSSDPTLQEPAGIGTVHISC